MKKIKIMLLSLLVVGAVGGALAFKANKDLTFFCGLERNFCPTPIPDIEKTLPAFASIGIYCTDGDNTLDCPFSVTDND